MDEPNGDRPALRRLVLVMGPGRSGTSTVAGALAMTGMEVPGKAIGGNPTNPSGFYEPRWVVDLHKRLLDQARVGTLDTSPDALARVAAVGAEDEVRLELRTWLAERFEEQPHLVVKDPRLVWFRDLWVDTARDLGVEPRFVTMLRHPAEVSASREKYYAKGADENRRPDDVARIGGWVNVALTTEQISQGSPRAFVRYTDLVADWRKVFARLGSGLDLTFEPGLDESPHPVDDFIDPGLHRVQVDWADVEVPQALRDLAERTWTTLTRIADEGESPDLVAELDSLRAEYLEMTEDALSLSRHAIQRLQQTARRRGFAQGVKEGRERAAQEGGQASVHTGDQASDQAGGRSGGLWARLKGGK